MQTITLEEMALLVKEMRSNQIGYFKTRNSQLLTRAKELEKQLDLMVENVLNPPVPNLFSEQN